MRRAAPLLLALVAAGCASAPPAGNGAGRITIETRTITSEGPEQAATIHGVLRLPAQPGRVPAIILMHGCSGALRNLGEWAGELTGAGYATFALDSFSGRGVTEICSGRESFSILNRLADAYRALAVLAAHPRVDSERIALMGFSHGGWTALWASHARTAERFKVAGSPDFAAYLPLYPGGCNVRLHDEASLVGGPVRIFHGAADDWTAIGPCRDYVARVRAAGRKVSLVEYDGAHHGFDSRDAGRAHRLPNVLNGSGCAYTQQADGRVLDAFGQPPSRTAPCLRRGATIGYDARLHARVVADVKAFLAETFGRQSR